MTTSIRTRAGVLVAAAVLAAGPLAALEERAHEPATVPGTTGQLSLPHAKLWQGPPLLGGDAGPIQDGMRAALDREGRIAAPTPRQTRELERALEQDLAAQGPRRSFVPTKLTYADGTVVMELDPELMNYSTVDIGPDGAVHASCVDGPTSTGGHAGATAATSAREEK